MSNNFKLVPKFYNNLLNIWYVSEDQSLLIAQLLMPNDQQRMDDVQVAGDICSCLKKRIKKTV